MLNLHNHAFPLFLGGAALAGNTGSNAPNTAPLPNPWAPTAGGAAQGAAPAGVSKLTWSF